MRSYSRTYRRSNFPDAYFPNIDRKEVDDLSIKGLNDNLRLIGATQLNKADYLGRGVKIGVIDSGCTQGGILQKNFVKGEGLQDENGHGTHVTSIIKAIAPLADIVMAKSMNKSGGGSRKDILSGTEWLLDQGVKVVNGSFAFNASTEIKEYIDLINQGVSAGVIFCFAAGNEGASMVSFPSNAHNVFSVGAVNNSMQITDFSNQGKEIDVVAPGKDILGDSPKGRMVTMSGTSQACPHAGGLLGLYVEFMRLKGVEPDFFQAYSDITKASTKDLGAKGFDHAYGYGLIKAYFAGIKDEEVKKNLWQRLFGWILR